MSKKEKSPVGDDEEVGIRNERMERLRVRLRASEGSHWYDQQGNACHEIQKKSGQPGEMRAVTKTDAAKLNLVPSVTNLLGRYENKSGIETWKRGMIFDRLSIDVLRHMVEAKIAGSESAFSAICRDVDGAAAKEAETAANKGSAFHALMEEAVMDGGLTVEDTTRILARSGLKAHTFVYGRIEGIFNAFKEMLFPNSGEMQGCEIEQSLIWNLSDPDGPFFGIGGKLDLIIVYQPGTENFKALEDTVKTANEADEFSGFQSVVDRLEQCRTRNHPFRLLADWKTRKPASRPKTKGFIPRFAFYESDAAQLAGYKDGYEFMNAKPVDLVANLLVASDILEFSALEDEEPRDPKYMPSGDIKSEVMIRFHSPATVANGLVKLQSAASMWKADESISSSRTRKSAFIPFISSDEEI
jgi:hypothetical protein|tara:strand:- start:2090 stop:3331 length:1242 start_codon:yes stop_codon:yes gene_type:complete